MAVIAFILIFLIPNAVSSPDNWIIDNSTNSVYVDDAKAYISVSPHTLKESGDIIINIRSKVYTGNVDVVFGFDTTSVKPTSAALYNFGTQQYQDVSTMFDKVNFDFGGMNTWYFRKNIPVVAGQNYRLKVSVQVPYISKGKYWIAIKPSAETIAQAITNGHLYYLDPWWDATWNNKKPIRINNTGNASTLTNYQVSLNVTYGSNMKSDFSDFRIVNETSGLAVPFWIEAYTNSSYARLWFNATSIPAASWTNSTYYLYYGNAAASSVSDGNTTFPFFDDFPGTTLNTTKWSSTGTPTVINSTVTVPYGSTIQTLNTVFFPGTALKERTKITGTWGAYADSSVGLTVYRDETTYIHFNNIDNMQNFGTAADANYHYVELKHLDDTHNYGILDMGQVVLSTRSNSNSGNIRTQSIVSGSTYYIDFVLIRKIVPVEPIADMGTEENLHILTWGNNYTNNESLVFSIGTNININFNITKRYSADIINWFVDSINQSNNFNNISLNFNVTGTKNVTATISNTTSGIFSKTWLVTLNMQLIAPVNGSTVYNPYPPAAPETTFTWSSTGYPFYNLLIGTDSNFNTVVSSTYHSSETTNVYLLSGKQYFWKVRTYIDALTPGVWSSVYNFNLTANYSLSANTTGVYGVVYEKKGDGSLLPIPDAVVNIANTTWSDIVISGTNGYYQFPGLKAGDVYTIHATANGYEVGSTEYVNASLNTWTQKNLFLQVCRSGFTCFYDQQFVQFTVQNIWFTKYAGVTATVYKGSELTASDTQTTGSDGTVNFLLIKDQQYRITFINATQGISVTWIGYPSKTEYYIITDATTSGWDAHGTDAATTTDISVTTQTINDTHAYVNMSYNDTLAGTSNLRFYLNKSIAGDPNNQTNLQSINGGNADQYNASFIVSGYGGNSYIIKVKADHSTYGTISYSYAVQFAQLPGPLGNFDGIIILMLFIAFILFVSGVFGQTTNSIGAGIIVGIIWILSGIGVFSAANVGLNFYLALTLASVVVLIMNINERGRHEALQ